MGLTGTWNQIHNHTTKQITESWFCIFEKMIQDELWKKTEESSEIGNLVFEKPPRNWSGSSKYLFIGNARTNKPGTSENEDELKQNLLLVFSRYGQVNRIILPSTDKSVYVSLPTFIASHSLIQIEFNDEDAAQIALKSLRGKPCSELGVTKLYLDYSIVKKEKGNVRWSFYL